MQTPAATDRRSKVPQAPLFSSTTGGSPFQSAENNSGPVDWGRFMQGGGSQESPGRSSEVTPSIFSSVNSSSGMSGLLVRDNLSSNGSRHHTDDPAQLGLPGDLSSPRPGPGNPFDQSTQPDDAAGFNFPLQESLFPPGSEIALPGFEEPGDRVMGGQESAGQGVLAEHEGAVLEPHQRFPMATRPQNTRAHHQQQQSRRAEASPQPTDLPWTEEELHNDQHKQHKGLMVQIDRVYDGLYDQERHLRNEKMVLSALLSEQEGLAEKLEEIHKASNAQRLEMSRMTEESSEQLQILSTVQREASISQFTVHELQSEREETRAKCQDELQQVSAKLEACRLSRQAMQERADAVLKRLAEAKQHQLNFSQFQEVTQKADRLASEIANMHGERSRLHLERQVNATRADLEQLTVEIAIDSVVESCLEFDEVARRCHDNVWCFGCSIKSLHEEPQPQ